MSIPTPVLLQTKTSLIMIMILQLQITAFIIISFFCIEHINVFWCITLKERYYNEVFKLQTSTWVYFQQSFNVICANVLQPFIGTNLFTC